MQWAKNRESSPWLKTKEENGGGADKNRGREGAGKAAAESQRKIIITQDCIQKDGSSQKQEKQRKQEISDQQCIVLGGWGFAIDIGHRQHPEANQWAGEEDRCWWQMIIHGIIMDQIILEILIPLGGKSICLMGAPEKYMPKMSMPCSPGPMSIYILPSFFLPIEGLGIPRSKIWKPLLFICLNYIMFTQYRTRSWSCWGYPSQEMPWCIQSLLLQTGT